jgi:hypothetical protein
MAPAACFTSHGIFLWRMSFSVTAYLSPTPPAKTCTHSHRTHPQNYALSLSLSLSLCHSHTHTLSLFLARAHGALSLPLPLPLPLPLSGLLRRGPCFQTTGTSTAKLAP